MAYENAGRENQTTARPTTFTDRAQTVVDRLSNTNSRLLSVLGRIRGSHPTPIEKVSDKPSPSAPTLDSVVRRTDQLLDQLEELANELDHSF